MIIYRIKVFVKFNIYILPLSGHEKCHYRRSPDKCRARTEERVFRDGEELRELKMVVGNEEREN